MLRGSGCGMPCHVTCPTIPTVPTGLGVLVAVRVAVTVLVGLFVSVRVDVGVVLEVAVRVAVGVLLKVGVGVDVTVGVGVSNPVAEGPAEDHQFSPLVMPAAHTRLSIVNSAAAIHSVNAPRPAKVSTARSGDRPLLKG